MPLTYAQFPDWLSENFTLIPSNYSPGLDEELPPENTAECKRCGMKVHYPTKHASTVHGDDVLLPTASGKPSVTDDEGRVDKELWAQWRRLQHFPIHTQVRATYGDRSAEVDEGIKDEIELLWQHGIDTISSCEGKPGGMRFIGLFNATPEQARLACDSLPWVVSIFATPQHWDRTFLEGSFIPLRTGNRTPAS